MCDTLCSLTFNIFHINKYTLITLNTEIEFNNRYIIVIRFVYLYYTLVSWPPSGQLRRRRKALKKVNPLR